MLAWPMSNEKRSFFMLGLASSRLAPTLPLESRAKFEVQISFCPSRGHVWPKKHSLFNQAIRDAGWPDLLLRSAFLAVFRNFRTTKGYSTLTENLRDRRLRKESSLSAFPTYCGGWEDQELTSAESAASLSPPLNYAAKPPPDSSAQHVLPDKSRRRCR